jgi:hypothetical protein
MRAKARRIVDRINANNPVRKCTFLEVARSEKYPTMGLTLRHEPGSYFVNNEPNAYAARSWLTHVCIRSSGIPVLSLNENGNTGT